MDNVSRVSAKNTENEDDDNSENRRINELKNESNIRNVAVLKRLSQIQRISQSICQAKSESSSMDSVESVEEKVELPKLSEFEIDFFEGLNDEEFLNCIESVEAERKHLGLENHVFQNFLLANEPTLVSGLHQAYDAINELELSHPLVPNGFERPGMDNIPTTPIAVMFSDRGHRINISQRTDLVLRDVEEMQNLLTKYIEKAKNTRSRRRAEIEESAIRLEEVKEARELFEQNIVIDAVDPITQRIPAEKFIWYMQDWLKTARLITEKLRMRNNSLKIQHLKLKNLLLQKLELGESIHEVDFEQQRIENKHLIEKIEQKNIHLIELKRINGKANLNLATHKNYLHKIQDSLRAIKNDIELTILSTEDFHQDALVAEKELEEAETSYHQVKDLIDHYRVPEVLEYVRVKSTLYDLKKSIKVLHRRMNIVKIVLESNIRQMMTVTGCKHAQAWWFIEPDENELDDAEEDEEYFQLSRRHDGDLYEFDIFDVLKKN